MRTTELLDVNHFQKRDIEKDETDKPFEQPMLPPGYAEILRSAVLSRRDAFRVRDAATGYGMRGCKTNPGVVILLHGPPGCGMVRGPMEQF